MKRPDHRVGPISFRHRRNLTKPNDRIGTSQKKCDIEGCGRAATWVSCVYGWDAEELCTTHKNEWMDATRQALETPQDVAA